jgi:probable HAF family extracellular repeat protein
MQVLSCDQVTRRGREAPSLFVLLCALVPLWYADTAAAQDGLPPCGRSIAYDVNDAGWIVGSVDVRGEERLAVAWVGDSILRLGKGGRSSEALAIDEEGRVVGTSRGDDRKDHGFLWRALLVDGDRVIDLGKLREDDRKTEAHAMNDHGVVVGQSGERAFVWEDGTIRKLPSPVACQEPDPGPPRGRPIVPKAPGDVDGDGVGDKDDLCPHTPEGATPDRHGCPMDTDDDGVMDGLDQCPDTARGASVNRHGCPMA